MHVAIQQTGHQVAAAGIDDLRGLTKGVTRVRPDIGNVAGCDGDVGVFDDLTRLNAYPAAVLDQEFGRRAPHRHVNQTVPQFSAAFPTHVYLASLRYLAFPTEPVPR